MVSWRLKLSIKPEQIHLMAKLSITISMHMYWPDISTSTSKTIIILIYIINRRRTRPSMKPHLNSLNLQFYLILHQIIYIYIFLCLIAFNYSGRNQGKCWKIYCNVKESEKKWLDPSPDPQLNLTGSSFGHAPPLHLIPWSSVEYFLRNTFNHNTNIWQKLASTQFIFSSSW